MQSTFPFNLPFCALFLLLSSAHKKTPTAEYDICPFFLFRYPFLFSCCACSLFIDVWVANGLRSADEQTKNSISWLANLYAVPVVIMASQMKSKLCQKPIFFSPRRLNQFVCKSCFPSSRIDPPQSRVAFITNDTFLFSTSNEKIQRCSRIKIRPMIFLIKKLHCVVRIECLCADTQKSGCNFIFLWYMRHE